MTRECKAPKTINTESIRSKRYLTAIDVFNDLFCVDNLLQKWLGLSVAFVRNGTHLGKITGAKRNQKKREKGYSDMARSLVYHI